MTNAIGSDTDISKECKIFLDSLLVPTRFPTGFKRENPKSFRFEPYSKKIRRRLDIYTPIIYDLWVKVEWDPDIKSFNERVESIQIGCENGQIFSFQPRMVSVTKERGFTVHTLSSDEAERKSAHLTEIEAWMSMHKVNHKVWTPEEIRDNPIEIENKKQLYAYIGGPKIIISSEFRERVLLTLKQFRKTTLDSLVSTLPDSSVDEVIQVVAEQILLKGIHSDIHVYAFGWATELSYFHELP